MTEETKTETPKKKAPAKKKTEAVSTASNEPVVVITEESELDRLLKTEQLFNLYITSRKHLGSDNQTILQGWKVYFESVSDLDKQIKKEQLILLTAQNRIMVGYDMPQVSQVVRRELDKVKDL